MNRKYLIPLTLISVLSANSEILTSTQKEILDTQKKIIEEDSKINQKDWLSNINISSSYSKDENNIDSKDLTINYEQDIFRFGAISNIIDAAKIQKQYDLLNLNITFDEYFNNIYTNVLNIKLIDLQIQKQDLTIKNKRISLEITKDEYNNGQTDVTTLNDMIMELNSLQESLVNYESSKQNYINNLKIYSNLDYKNIEIPPLKQKALEDYLNSSKEIQLQDFNQELSKLEYKIKKAEYLPTLSVNTSYNKNLDNQDKDESYNYGLTLSMPIDFSSLNQKEKYKLNYLLAKKQKEQKTTEKNSEYETVIENIKKYSKLDKIARDDIVLYEELLQNVNAEYQAGYKAKEDVDILSNTKKIRELDSQLYDIYTQIELISLNF